MEWISIKERLPDDEQRVWVVFVWNDGKRNKPPEVRQMSFYKEDYWHRKNMFVSPDGAHFSSNTITHWMPLVLPNLPK